MSTIHHLAGRGDPFELLVALDAGADPNERGLKSRTPLMEAAKRDNRVAARLLLGRGADLEAVADGRRTALLEASELAMKRLLLDAGADPDHGRIAGMTPLAFFASFRDRRLVDLFLSYGADPEEKTDDGSSVRTLLDDPATVWTKLYPEGMDTPEHRRRNEEAILRLSDGLRLTPESYVTAHRNILIWSFGSFFYDDPALAAWASRVRELLGSPEGLEAAYRLHLAGDELEAALRSLLRMRRRIDRDRLQKERRAEFEALHLTDG